MKSSSSRSFYVFANPIHGIRYVLRDGKWMVDYHNTFFSFLFLVLLRYHFSVLDAEATQMELH